MEQMKAGPAEANIDFIKEVEKEVLLGSSRIPFIKSTSIDSWADSRWVTRLPENNLLPKKIAQCGLKRRSLRTHCLYDWSIFVVQRLALRQNEVEQD